MEQTIHHEEEKENKRKGLVWSIVLHLILILLAILPLMKISVPEPAGIAIAFGEIEVGEGDAPAASSEPSEDIPASASIPTSEPEPSEPEVSTPAPIAEATPTVKKDVITDDRAKEIAIKKKKEEEKKRRAEEAAKKKAKEEAKRKEREKAKKKAEAEKKKKEAADKKRKAAEAKKKAEAEAKRKAAEEARKKAEAEAERKRQYEEAKNKIGNAFKNSGSGQGKTGTSGNQGNPDGDPDAKKLEGIKAGAGTIGGGLKGRDVLRKPSIQDNSQETGKVVVDICVGKDGKVTSAKYTQKGSTTTSSRLISLAEKTAKKYTFSKGSVDKQCGTVTFDFRLK